MGPRRRWVQAAIGVALVGLVGGRWLAVSTAGRLWAEAMGVPGTHGDIARLRVLLLATAMSAALLWCLGNLYLVYRSIGSVHVPRRLGNIEILEVVPRRYLLLIALGIGTALAVLLSHGAGDWWRVRALAGLSTSVGIRDPVLGEDLAYYLFRLPWHRTLHGFATLLSGVLLAVTGVLYAALGAIRWAERRLQVTELARAHLGVLLAAFALALAWGYRLEPTEYVAGVHSVPADVVLTGVRIPAARLLSGLALVAAGASVLWIWAARMTVVVVSWVILGAASVAGHYVVPVFATATRRPEELPLSQVVKRSDEFARLAYGRVPAAQLVRTSVLTDPDRLVGYATALRRGPVWDAFALTVSLDRVAAPRPATAFHEATLAAYPDPEGRQVPVYLAARRVDLTALRSAAPAPTWEAVHVGPHAVARGAVAVLAHRAAADGLPLFIADLSRPEVAGEAPADLSLAIPEMLTAPGIADFAVRAPAEGGARGVRAGGFWRRLALAWALQSPQLIGSEAVGDSAVLIWERDVASRLHQFAPFADFGAPYAVVVETRLYWLASGYVAADAFPLAPEARWQGEAVRYLRAGYLGVVDAATGATAVYLVADPDPLSAAWASLAPDVVQPADAFPEALAGHIRYPAEAFAVQATLARATQLEAAPEGGGLQRRGALGVGAVPYWWFGPVPGDSANRVRLMAAVEGGVPSELRGMVVGTARGTERELRLFRFDPAAELPVPSAAARAFAELRPDTAGIRGAVRLVPFDDGVLAIQTGYAGARDSRDPPRIADIAVQWGGLTAVGPTLAAALRRAGTEQHAAVVSAETWREAGRWFERMDAARRAGDWTAFGRAYDALRRLLAGPPDSRP